MIRTPVFMHIALVLTLFLGACATSPKPAIETVQLQDDSVDSKTEATLTEPLPEFDDFRLPLARIEFPLPKAEATNPLQPVNFDVLGYIETVIQNEYYVTIQFALMCRDVQESSYVALTANHMMPLSHRTINWSLKDQSGVVMLDENGYGQIRLTAANSRKTDRLKLASNNEVLYIQAGDIKKIVTPPEWCM